MQVLSRARSRPWRRALFFMGVLLAVAAGASAIADAAVTESRAEINGTRLRIEGRALPNRAITVDGVSMGTSDASGSFRIERDPFTRPADCTLDVDDGSGTPTVATLSGCTVSAPPSPALRESRRSRFPRGRRQRTRPALSSWR